MTQAAEALQLAPSKLRGVKYVALGGPSGYAVAAKRYMLALARGGIPISWAPMVESSQGRLGFAPSAARDTEDGELAQFCNCAIDYDTVVVHMVPEFFPLWIKREPGKRVIGCTVWETDVLPSHWPALLNSVDALIVPCHWNKEVFIRNGVTVPISVIPHIAQPPQTKQRHPWQGTAPEDFVFYSINTCTARKSIWLTVEAYLQAFSAADPVCLLLKTTQEDYTVRPRRWRKLMTGHARPLTRNKLKRILAEYPNAAKVVLLDEVVSDEEIGRLHQRGDCYVSLCRSEGWGVGAFDACTYGNPVVITGYGGQTDFLPSEQAHLIDYRLIAIEDRSSWGSYNCAGSWAEPDMQHAVQTLRAISQNQHESRGRGEKLKKHVCAEFSEDTVGDQFVKFLRD